MLLRASFGNTPSNIAVVAAILAISSGFLWTGGALTGENASFEWITQRLQAEAKHDQQSTLQTQPEQVYLGSAPWICTPSGFGQTSTCRERDMQLSSSQ